MKCQVCNKETSNFKQVEKKDNLKDYEVICNDCTGVVKDANNETPLYLDKLSWKEYT